MRVRHSWPVRCWNAPAVLAVLRRGWQYPLARRGSLRRSGDPPAPEWSPAETLRLQRSSRARHGDASAGVRDRRSARRCEIQCRSGGERTTYVYISSKMETYTVELSSCCSYFSTRLKLFYVLICNLSYLWVIALFCTILFRLFLGDNLYCMFYLCLFSFNWIMLHWLIWIKNNVKGQLQCNFHFFLNVLLKNRIGKNRYQQQMIGIGSGAKKPDRIGKNRYRQILKIKWSGSDRKQKNVIGTSLITLI